MGRVHARARVHALLLVLAAGPHQIVTLAADPHPAIWPSSAPIDAEVVVTISTPHEHLRRCAWSYSGGLTLSQRVLAANETMVQCITMVLPASHHSGQPPMLINATIAGVPFLLYRVCTHAGQTGCVRFHGWHLTGRVLRLRGEHLSVLPDLVVRAGPDPSAPGTVSLHCEASPTNAEHELECSASTIGHVERVDLYSNGLSIDLFPMADAFVVDYASSGLTASGSSSPVSFVVFLVLVGVLVLYAFGRSVGLLHRFRSGRCGVVYRPRSAVTDMIVELELVPNGSPNVSPRLGEEARPVSGPTWRRHDRRTVAPAPLSGNGPQATVVLEQQSPLHCHCCFISGEAFILLVLALGIITSIVLMVAVRCAAHCS